MRTMKQHINYQIQQWDQKECQDKLQHMLAGIVITKDPVDTYVPLYVRDGLISTQFIMTTLEELRIIKDGLLGLTYINSYSRYNRFG